MQMFQKGRSMIEMLGVLAIIGVLSIGGIVLYRRAVNNHQANTILDDANRLAFVITERDNFAPNDNITNVEFNQTSTYSIVPFVGEKARQYGIMVENVPKGVCEALVPKAAIEYKVRVMPYQSTEYINQIADTGTVYDSFHKDICTNDVNDVVLFFGDTSAQCNKPDEGEDYVKCLSNAECCGGSFCWYPNDTNCYSSGVGECRKVSDFTPTPDAATTTTAAGKTWVRSSTMNWWSAQNWCAAQGKNPLRRTDIGCGNNLNDTYCTQSGTPLKAIQEKWGKYYSFHWLEDFGNNCIAYGVNLKDSHIFAITRSNLGYAPYALCH